MIKLRIKILKAIQWRLSNILSAIQHSLELYDSSIDEEKLNKLDQRLTNKQAIENCKKILEPTFLEYISTISEEAHAMSLEQAAFLLNLCKSMNPKSVVDLGSGFSSYVLRFYSRTSPIEVYSVDDNAIWLEKSKHFLQAYNLDIDRMILAEDYFTDPIKSVPDLIYYDLGNMETRKYYLSKVLDFFSVNRDTLLIIDDIHKTDFRNYAIKTLKERSLTFYNLKKSTGDKFGRHALLVISSPNQSLS